MKKILLLLIITAGVVMCNNLNAQLTGIAINDDGSKADTSAILDVNVNTTTPKRGFLLPRLTTTQRDAIFQPAKALLIYCTDVDSLEINVGTPLSPKWLSLPGVSPDGWLTTGNSGTNSGANFLGTTDNASLSLRTDGVERMVVDSIGRVAIGSTAYGAYNPKFLVDYGNTTSNTVAFLKGSIDSYLQINLSNKSSGANASTDYIATADNGTDSTFYIDMGINGSNYSPSVENFGGPNDGYLYTYARNLLIGTGKASTDIIFLLGGGVTKTNTALRIAAPSGNIIIGTGESSNSPVGNVLRGPNGKGTNIPGGSLTIQGGSATGTATGGSVNITGGSSVTGTAGAVNINAGSNFPTNINTGISTSDVTIGGNSNNILFPKFTTVGNLIYTASNTGQIGSTAQLTWDNTNGRLGIGTNSPADNLHVAGNIRMVDGNQGTGKVMVSDANGTATWATPASLGVTNSLSLSNNTLTSTVNGVSATSKVICCLSNTSSGNTLTTTVNGVTGAAVSIINSNTLSLSGNNLISTVNGIASATLDLSPVISQNAWNLTGNSGTTAGTNFLGTTDATALVLKTNGGERMRILPGGNVGIGTTAPGSKLDVKGALRLSGSTSGFVGFQPAAIAGSTTYTLPAADGTAGQQLTTDGSGNLSWINQTGATTVSNSSATNTLSTTVNGVTGAGVNIINSNALSLSGNTLTSTVNGIAATSDAVSSVSNTSSANTLNTTVNGVTGAGVNIINTNALSLSGDKITSTVNGIASNALDLTPAISANAWLKTGNSGTTAGTNFIGTIDAKDFVTKTNNTERMRITSAGNVGIGLANPSYKLQVFAASDPVYLTGVQTGSTDDSLLTISSGVVKKIASLGNITNITKNVYSVTLPIIGNNSGTTVTLTVPNVPYTVGGPNPVVIVNPETDLPGALIIAWSRVTATNTVKIALRNVANSSILSQTIDFDISIIQ